MNSYPELIEAFIRQQMERHNWTQELYSTVHKYLGSQSKNKHRHFAHFQECHFILFCLWGNVLFAWRILFFMLFSLSDFFNRSSNFWRQQVRLCLHIFVLFPLNECDSVKEQWIKKHTNYSDCPERQNIATNCIQKSTQQRTHKQANANTNLKNSYIIFLTVWEKR